MYELANAMRIKEMNIFNVVSCRNMMESWLNKAKDNGTIVPELFANVHVYEADDMVFSVEYVKMICNLAIIFRELYDTKLYDLRINGLINKDIYSKINFHEIFSEINDVLNFFIDNQYDMYEFGIYHSEISLETSMALYSVFNTKLTNILKDFVDINILNMNFNKHHVKYIQDIYEKIFLQLENVFSIYF